MFATGALAPGTIDVAFFSPSPHRRRTRPHRRTERHNRTVRELIASLRRVLDEATSESVHRLPRTRGYPY